MNATCYRCTNPTNRQVGTKRGVLCSKCVYSKDKVKIIKRAAAWRNNNRDRFNETAAFRYARKKFSSITRYGGECVHCGEREISFLCIDHIHDDGSKDRALWRNKVSDIHTWLKLQGYPEGYQVLCHSCNLKKEIERRRLQRSPTWEKNQRIKLTVLSNYGGSCKCCGQGDVDKLVIDHIRGGGSIAKKKYPSRNVYRFLEKKPVDYSQFQILCQNCNQSKASFGECGHHKVI